MQKQLSNCCKADIELTGKQEHSKAFACKKCGRIIGTTTKKNKLKQLQVKANKLYREIIDVIDDINDTVERFYKGSSKYAKLLKTIENESYVNSKTNNIKRSKEKKKTSGKQNVRRKKARSGRRATRGGRR